MLVEPGISRVQHHPGANHRHHGQHFEEVVEIALVTVKDDADRRGDTRDA
jgi:hypothetical protein